MRVYFFSYTHTLPFIVEQAQISLEVSSDNIENPWCSAIYYICSSFFNKTIKHNPYYVPHIIPGTLLSGYI